MSSQRPICALTLRAIDQHAIARYLLAAPKRTGDVTRPESLSAHRTPNAELITRNIDGSESSYEICVAEASPKIVYALVGAFLYDQLASTIVVRSSDGEEVWVRGEVVRCLFISGRVHIAEIALDTPSDICQIIEL